MWLSVILAYLCAPLLGVLAGQAAAGRKYRELIETGGLLDAGTS